VEQVETLIRRELDFLVNNAIPPAEVAYAKRALRGSYISDCETYSGQAGTLGYYDSIDTWRFASDYLANVEKVTPEQVQEVARKYLKSDESVAVILKPRAAPAPQAPPKTGT
jgi:zinc protease